MSTKAKAASNSTDMKEYEERFQAIDSEIEAIRSTFDATTSNADGFPNVALLETRIDELEEAEKKLMKERHRLNKLLLRKSEKENDSSGNLKTSEAVRKSISLPLSPNTSATTPSQRRASDWGSMGGLSELSKQLRISQAKSEAQTVEIHRLERQLRLLADLQGINVKDLRRALERACEDEAFGELQHRIAKLQAELEAATLLHPHKSTDIALPDNAETETLKAQIKNLQKSEKNKSKEIDRLLQAMEAKEQEILESTKKYNDFVAESSKKNTRMEDSFNRLSAEYDAMADIAVQTNEKLKKARAELGAEREKSEQRRRDFETKMRVDMSKLNDDLGKEMGRHEGDDSSARLQDMEQQLKSLYTAVGVLSEDHESDKTKRALLKNDLDEADSTVARQMDNEQKSPHGGGDLYQSLLMHEYAQLKEAAAKNPNLNKGIPILEQQQQQQQPGTSVGLLISGQLLVKSKGILKQWKARPSRLILCGNYYQWDVGDKSYDIEFGISKVEINQNHPLSFVVQTNPLFGVAPTIAAACKTEEEYHRWMSALNKATTGGD